MIGEHTDYNDGFVMPLALSGRHTAVVGTKTTGGKIRIATESSIGDANSVEVDASKSGNLGGGDELFLLLLLLQWRETRRKYTILFTYFTQVYLAAKNPSGQTT